MYKKIFKLILENISFLYSILSCLNIFFILRKKKINVFISPEGGFGPTILKPIMLSCFYREQSNFVLIFGYHPNRHNILISKLFGENFLWLKLSNKFFPFSLINEKKKYFVFQILTYLLKNFSKVEKVEDFNKFFCEYLKIPNLPEQSETHFGTYRKVHQFINQNEKFISYKSDYFNFIKNKKNFKIYDKKCVIFIRGAKYQKDSTKSSRNSDILKSYKTSIIENIKKGWQFFLSGDVEIQEDWIKNFGDKIIFAKKTNFNLDEYNLFSGLIADCFVSTGSGPTNWKFFDTNKPFLVLDGYPIGMGWYKSTVAYKIVYKKNFKNINEIFEDKSMSYNPPIECRFTNEQQKEKILTEFLNFQQYGKVLGLSGEELNLEENSILNCGFAKASKTWREIQESILNTE